MVSNMTEISIGLLIIVKFILVTSSEKTLSFNKPTCSSLYKLGLIPNETLTTVVAKPYLPFIMWDTDSKNVTHYSGLTIELLNIIRNVMKCNINIIQPVDDYFGVVINGSWQGIVGMVARKEVDFAAVQIIMTYDRIMAVDFTTPFHFQYMGILIRQPVAPITIFKMLKVFDVYAWCLIFIVTVGAIFFSYIVNKMDSNFDTKSNKKCLIFYFWYTYRVVTVQAGAIREKTWPNKIFQSVWRISMFLLFSMYVGSLIAVMTTNRPYLPFTDVKGLAKAVAIGKYKICIVSGTGFYNMFMGADSPEFKILRNFLADNSDYSPPNIYDCEQKFLTESNLAFINELSYLQFMQIKYCGNYSMILLKDRLFPSYFGFPFPKKSPLTSIISSILMETVENGFVSFSIKTYSAQLKFCNILEVDNVYSPETARLSFIDIGIAFVLFLSGILLSLTFFMLEKLCDSRQNWQPESVSFSRSI